MIKLWQTTTGTTKGVKYLWLVKDMDVYRNYSKTECYAVLAFNGDGWFTMYSGKLNMCRKFMHGETVVEI